MATIRHAFDSMSWGSAPESASLAHGWLDRAGRRFGHFIGGGFVEPAPIEHFATINPANRVELARIAQGSAGDVDRAVRAARGAQPAWWALGGHGRARYLYAIARLIQKHSRLLAVVESLDNGKPIRESRDVDIPLAARHFYYHAGWAQLLSSEFPGHGPLGVVGQIIPWNFPLLMLAWKIAPALATGNTVVLKPAEFTSLSALLFAELCTEAGLPPGVVNIVTGDGRTGEALVVHSDVDKIAFTGSTDVGRLIRAATAGSGKKLSLELGGKSPFIVLDDADLDSAVEGVVDAIWFNQGQVCCAGSRILVHEGVAERLIAKLRARMETLRAGDPLDKSIDIGAIIAPVQLEKIERLVKRGVEEGATLWQPSWSCPTEGLFYPPTLFTNVAPASTIAQVEIFGPVVVSMSFRTPAEAVELANNTRYGLAASVWTENVNTALDLAPQLKAGTVWINCTNMFDAAAGFGGYRESGFGREGGKEGLWEYLTAARRQAGPPAGGPAADAESVILLPPCRPAAVPPVDRTAKLYIGGKQVRPDSGYSQTVLTSTGTPAGGVALGSRKDVRNAVEAAHAARGWAKATAHLRAQVLYYIAENLSLRGTELAGRIADLTGIDPATAAAEVERSIERTFTYAAWADKFDGRIHSTPYRNITFAMHEPIGVLGLVAPESPSLLGFLSVVLPAVAMGNTVVAVPSERWPLLAIDCSQIFDTSDVPAGVINIITGARDELASVLAAHDDVDGVWYTGTQEGSAEVERLSIGNMKRTWVDYGIAPDWWDDEVGAGKAFLREATQVKNIWVPYGA